MDKNKTFKSLGLYLIIFAVIAGAIIFINPGKEKVEKIPYSKYVKQLEDKNIKSMNIDGTTITGKYNNGKAFETYAPSLIENGYLFEKYIAPQSVKGDLKVDSPKAKENPWYIQMLPTLLILLVVLGVWIFFMRQSQGGAGKAMSFGKSKAKLQKVDEKNKVTFSDVAGLDEEKQDLEEVVDFLKHPKRYIELGARIPKGILLVGPPGTGKTYLSRATAGEAGVPFYSISGSDFVEMFVGVGASRVRDLFSEAKKNAPCIIFIDEIDAVGRKRGAGLGGGHDEREQTLNQLLVEMDGFGINEGIIILAATNRPDILDTALLRPGRFDREVLVGVPDVKGREAIFKIHSKNKPLDEDVDLEVLAKRTPGFTPADIENLLNEAALLTARDKRKKIHMDIMEEAITRVLAGPEKKSKVITEEERKLTAYHEAGHAVIGKIISPEAPIHQVTIIPRGRAGGFTMSLPKEEKFYATKKEMTNMIVSLLGGRVAEKLVLDDISTGASNDIERATEIAKSMVTKYGMSDKIGPINYGTADEIFLGNGISTSRNHSEEMSSEIDHEIKYIIEAAYARAEIILKEHMDKLETVAQALLEVETLDAGNFEDIFNGTDISEIKKKIDQEAERRHKRDAATKKRKSAAKKSDAEHEEKTEEIEEQLVDKETLKADFEETEEAKEVSETEEAYEEGDEVEETDQTKKIEDTETNDKKN